MATTFEASPERPPEPPDDGPGVPRWILVAFGLGGLLFLSLTVVGILVKDDGAVGTSTSSGRWQGAELDPPRTRPDFVLTDTATGEPFDFRAETDGSLTLLLFGYTSCPDVCPIHMDTIAQAIERVDVPVRMVFVTTDPGRDTPERIRSYLDAFDPNFVGLHGTIDEVVTAQETAGITPAVIEDPDEDGQYVVGHNAGVMVITPDDRMHLTYPFGTRLDDWVADLPRIAEEPAWNPAEAG
jgi:protein SCO1/2